MSLFRIIEPMGHNHNQYLPGYPHGQSALVNAKPRQAYKKRNLNLNQHAN